MSPDRRRRTALHLRKTFSVSQRRACRVVGQHRSTQRYRARICRFLERLVRAIRELAQRFPRYGVRRIYRLLRREGWRVNHKRVERLWRQEGLKVRQKRRKHFVPGQSTNACHRRRATKRNQVWTYDFLSDQTVDGRRVKILAILDEFTRECLHLVAARSIRSHHIVAALDRLVLERGAPEFVRADNGPEFVADLVQCWLRDRGIDAAFIAPGHPWENGYIESFNDKLRDELLNRELFTTLFEVNWSLAQFRYEFNHERPHMSLQYLTPTEFAAKWAPSAYASAKATAPGAPTTAGTAVGIPSASLS